MDDDAPNEWGQLPASSFTPVPIEQLDWDEVHAQMRAIEVKLARIKLGWWEMMTSGMADGRP